MAGAGFETIDEHRRNQGFRTVAETIELGRTNILFDPYSTLIARDAEIGSGNIFHPGVVVHIAGGTCVLGNGNTFWPSTIVLAANGGRILIGNACSFGPGGVQVKANQPGTELRIGDRVRLLNGAELVGSSRLGAGSQVIGPISAQNVDLAGGDDFTGPDPDRRGAVLKGFGIARAIRLGMGEVVNGAGDFAQAAVERQRADHPRSRRRAHPRSMPPTWFTWR